jgi:hypothetical protein
MQNLKTGEDGRYNQKRKKRLCRRIGSTRSPCQDPSSSTEFLAEVSPASIVNGLLVGYKICG